MSRELRHLLDDMLSAIEGLTAEVQGKSFEDYSTSWVLRRAAERAISIVSEASRGLPPEALAATPDIPWAKVRGIGNVLRHEYHRLSDRLIWGVIVEELPRLRDAIDVIQWEIEKDDTQS